MRAKNELTKGRVKYCLQKEKIILVLKHIGF